MAGSDDSCYWPKFYEDRARAIAREEISTYMRLRFQPPQGDEKPVEINDADVGLFFDVGEPAEDVARALIEFGERRVESVVQDGMNPARFHIFFERPA